MSLPVILIFAPLAFLACATAASFVWLPDGALRVFDFPRTQIAALAAILAFAAIIFLEGVMLAGSLAMAGVVMTLQLWLIAPYTQVWSVEARTATDYAPEQTLSVLVSNVLQTNDTYDLLADLIGEHQPDIVLLMEVDERWVSEIAGAVDTYPWRLELPLDNLYGIALYSKLELVDITPMYILRDDIPSISTICRLGNNKKLRFIAIHPEPPLPHTFTTERDAEIIIAGQMALADELPAIVTGDLNDVAWSRTTSRFRRLSGLLDPRVGRGMYNTFNANWPVFRWPLDHLFHDGQFSLVTMKRLRHIGSDHFPLYFELALDRPEDDSAPGPDPKHKDFEEAVEVIEKAGQRPEAALAPLRANVSKRD